MGKQRQKENSQCLCRKRRPRKQVIINLKSFHITEKAAEDSRHVRELVI